MSFRIALDAGHGSNTWSSGGGKGVKYDNGKLFEEHTFNAAVVKIAKVLAEFNGIEVVLTQPPNGIDKSLSERVSIARSNKVDLFISFHADANANTDARGHWAFYWHTDQKSKKLAQIWDKHANQIMGNQCRGVLESKLDTWTDFHMCREPIKYGIPSILVEHDFMTNRQSLDLLLSEEFQMKCAETAIRASCEYLGIAYKSYISKEDEKMIEDLKKQVEQLQKQVAALENYNKMSEVPTFAQNIVNKLVEEKVLLEPNGRSYDLYSILAVLSRKGVI